MDTKINRKVGVRVSMVVGAVAVFFITMTILGNYPDLDQAQAFDTLKWLLGTISAGIVGDTWRPSGQKVASHKLVPAPAIDTGIPPIR